MKGKILITGAFGYLGGRIAKFLAENSSYWLRLGGHVNIFDQSDWLKHGEIVSLDLLSGKGIHDACKDIHTIIHLAALDAHESGQNQEKALLVNTLGTIKLLESAKATGAKRFIYFSTAHIYGSPLEGVITEKTLPRPIHPYSITHKAAEDYVIAANDQKALSGIVIRLSNGYGYPHSESISRWNLVVNDLCRQAITDKKIVVRASGQKRDFVSLSDVARATLHFIQLPIEELQDGIFNVGGECSLTIAELAEFVADRSKALFGIRPKIQYPENAETNIPVKLEYKIDKAKSTGFSCIGNMQEEIDATLILCSERICSIEFN